MSRKATIIIEGNTRQAERMIHELNKIVSEANREPELTASLQTANVDSEQLSVENAFTDGGQNE